MSDILTIQVQDVVASKATANFTIQVVNPDTITTASLPNASQSIAYSTPVVVTGGIPPYAGQVIGNSGANSWTFSGTNIIGTPTVPETALLTILMLDSLGVPSSRQLNLTTVAVTPAATPTFSPVAGSYGSAQTVTISSTTPANTIYYTINGTTPTTGSTVYSGPISVAVTETVKAIATAAGFSTSAVGSATYTITSGTTPVFNFTSFDSTIVPSQILAVPSHSALSAPDISLMLAGQGHAGGGAWYQTIQDISAGFTTDFTFQFVGSNAVAGGLPVISGFTFAVQNDPRGPTITGDANSDGFGSFPEFPGNIPIRNSIGFKFSLSNGGGNYFNRPTGRINGTGCYFNGGFADFLVPYNDIQPYGIDMNTGNVMHAWITYDTTTATMVLQDTVTLAACRYSWPATIPTFLGQNTGYIGFGSGGVATSAPAPVNAGVQIKLKSWAFARGFNTRLATPTFSVTPGQYTGAQSVSLSGPAGATIYATTNGLEPTSASAPYLGSPINISANTILKAIAIQSGFTDSLVATGNYQIAAGGTPLINFPSGFASSAGLLNLVGRAALSGASVILTDGTQPPAAAEVGGMWYPAPVTISSFTSSFQFNLAGGNARGFCFVLQNVPASSTSVAGSTGGPFALSWGSGGNATGSGMGAGASNIANQGGTITTQQIAGFAKSMILAIGPINGSGSWCGVFTNGAQPSQAGSTNVGGTLNFQSGHNFRVDLSYSGGTTLNVTITDLTSSASIPLAFTVNIASVVGSTGFAGFTGADFGGGVQKINTWTM